MLLFDLAVDVVTGCPLAQTGLCLQRFALKVRTLAHLRRAACLHALRFTHLDILNQVIRLGVELHIVFELPQGWMLTAGRSQAFVVNANYNRNFKTRETEAKIDNNTPDADELNAKLQGYLEGVQVSLSSHIKQA